MPNDEHDKPAVPAVQIAADAGVDLEASADMFVQRLTELSPADADGQARQRDAVEGMGVALQKRAASEMGMLKQPLKKLAQQADDGGEVANALINLKVKVEELDPGKFDLEAGWLSRTMGRVPGIGTPLKRYFSRYESAQTVIAAIVRALEQGRDQLVRDNVTLGEDQKRMREMCGGLDRNVKLAQLIDQKLQYRLDRDLPVADPRGKFIAEELLFPLRQRIMDLQQQLAVNQQGVLATELVIRNNKELVRGVERALNVTVTALQVAATVAVALANQTIVLDKVNAVNKTTSDLIAGTAARLKTQAASIQKQAAGTQISMDSLKSAFADVNAALADISTFRAAALPKMAATILELDTVTAAAERAIASMDKGNRARPLIDG